MARLLLAVLLTLVPLVALAQDAPEPEETPETIPAAEQAYTGYSAVGFGFSLELPEGGTIKDPSTEDWVEEAPVAFEWYAGAGSPIAMIQGRVDGFETELDDDTFNVFCETLLENWSDEDAYNLITANRRIEIAPLTWNLIEVENKTDDETKQVYYSVFTVYSGKNMYTISMYYLEPVNDRIQEYGIPVVASFQIDE